MFMNDNSEKKELDIEELFRTIETAGYLYDAKQDIFYSTMDPWQRGLGYCRLYDEAAAVLNMIIDCEPIYFEYSGKKWLIELWKGQYAMTTGGEIGVYVSEGPDLKIPGIFEGTFYKSVSNADLLEMSYSLKKDNQVLFTRRDKHWWLTGFKLGEFSEPSELVMDVSITLKDKTMCNAFIEGLKKAGYSENEFKVHRNTVKLNFAKPRTPQPKTRTLATDTLTQLKNRILCWRYRNITDSYDNFPDKAKAVYMQDPEMFDNLLKIGKIRSLFEVFGKVQEYSGKY